MKKITEECIPKKTACKQSKGWWSHNVTGLSREVKRAKRRFAKRSDKANERKVQDSLNRFKEEEAIAKDNYLEGMVQLMEPKKPTQFWKIVNNERKTRCKTVVQPIMRDDGMLADSAEEIFEEMKKRYGKESLDVKENEPEWYECVEQEARDRNEIELHNIKENTYSKNCSHENSNLLVEEVEAAVEALAGYSAPNPEEQIFNIMLKRVKNQWRKGYTIFFKNAGLQVCYQKFLNKMRR